MYVHFCFLTVDFFLKYDPLFLNIKSSVDNDGNNIKQWLTFIEHLLESLHVIIHLVSKVRNLCIDIFIVYFIEEETQNQRYSRESVV
jgi:hypothetical protein